MKRPFLLFSIVLLWFISGVCSADELERNFANPPIKYRPFAWWHWMGPNFSEEGIVKDLEAMKASGLGGATIFNATSAVQESQCPTLNNPWPNQTYRSDAYWKAIRKACEVAEHLGMELGLHNSPGYSTTGGPWIDEAKGMKHLGTEEVKIEGGKKVSVTLQRPQFKPYENWGDEGKSLPDQYDDIAVIAVPDAGNATQKVLDVSKYCDKDGHLVWNAPKGSWLIYRIGYASTMSRPHPVPDDLICKTMEVNKIDADYGEFFWDNMLNPLKENVGQYFGRSFKHILIDSYEAGDQNWSRHFKEDFIRMKGYDPTPWLPFVVADKKDTFSVNPLQIKRFRYDFNDVIARLFQTNSWELAHNRISAMGLLTHHEPYWGQFSVVAGAATADIPMGEFWVGSDGKIEKNVSAGARAAGHTVIGAEAFSMAPWDFRLWTEDPAMMKASAEGAFASGVNRMNLHQWVHQPYDDRYQPGMSMGWWGSHFNRYQSWFEPGKAFFHYLGRCQYLLQQGAQVIDFLALDSAPDRACDAVSTEVFLHGNITVKDGNIVLPSGREYRLMEIHGKEEILPAVLDRMAGLLSEGATFVSQKPMRSPSLSDYPDCDSYVMHKADSLWNIYQGKQIFSTRQEAIQTLHIAPDYTVLKGTADLVHRHTASADIYYIGNLTNKAQQVEVSLRINNRLPELWNAENGSVKTVEQWRPEEQRTVVSLELLPYQSRFVVFRRQPTQTEIFNGSKAKDVLLKADSIAVSKGWQVHFLPKLDSAFNVNFDSLSDFSLSQDKRIKYFTGTAIYSTQFKLNKTFFEKGSRVTLDLGEMNDIAILKVNGLCVDTLWYPPYQKDVTPYIKKGKNDVVVEVTDNWANRMIGDEQVDADFEWGKDRKVMGRAMKGYPEWFLKNQPRPQKDRKAFEVWYYYRKDSPLEKAGLDGPVKLIKWSK